MASIFRRLPLAACALAAAVLQSAHAAPPKSYHLIQLGFDSGAALAVNAKDQIAGTIGPNGLSGYFGLDGIPSVFRDNLWTPLAMPPGMTNPYRLWGQVNGIARNGATVGFVFNDPNNAMAIATYWSERNVPTLLPVPAGQPHGRASAIDATGRTVVGQLAENLEAAFGGTCFTWSPGASTLTLLTAGGTQCTASAVNTRGQMVGNMVPAGGSAAHGFVESNGLFTDVGVMSAGGTTSALVAINDRGTAVGTADMVTDTGVHETLAVYWDGHHLNDIGSLGDGYASAATGINSQGDIVGTSNGAIFLYSAGQLVNVNARIDNAANWSALQATAIGDDGVIVGYGSFDGSRMPNAILLVPSTN